MGFDVCAGTDCQVYYGRNRATDMTDAAVDNTAGEMIYYGGKPADTVVYCASNGGATEDAANVWSSIPYLVGKKDPYEATTNIPNYNWSVTYTTDELTWILEQKGYSIGTVKNVYVAEFTPMGNVSKVTFEGSRDSVTVKGETCRTIFYSSTYNKSVKSQRFTINGAAQPPAAFISMTAIRCSAPWRASASSAAAEKPSDWMAARLFCPPPECPRWVRAKRLRFPRTAPLPSPAAAAATISA